MSNKRALRRQPVLVFLLICLTTLAASAQEITNLYFPIFNFNATINQNENYSSLPFSLEMNKLNHNNQYFMANSDVALQVVVNWLLFDDLSAYDYYGGIIHSRFGYAFWHKGDNIRSGLAIDLPIRTSGGGLGITWFRSTHNVLKKRYTMPQVSFGSMLMKNDNASESGAKFGVYFSTEWDHSFVLTKKTGVAIKPFVFATTRPQIELGFRIGFCIDEPMVQHDEPKPNLNPDPSAKLGTTKPAKVLSQSPNGMNLYFPLLNIYSDAKGNLASPFCFELNKYRSDGWYYNISSDYMTQMLVGLITQISPAFEGTGLSGRFGYGFARTGNGAFGAAAEMGYGDPSMLTMGMSLFYFSNGKHGINMPVLSLGTSPQRSPSTIYGHYINAEWHHTIKIGKHTGISFKPYAKVNFGGDFDQTTFGMRIGIARYMIDKEENIEDADIH